MQYIHCGINDDNNNVDGDDDDNNNVDGDDDDNDIMMMMITNHYHCRY